MARLWTPADITSVDPSQGCEISAESVTTSSGSEITAVENLLGSGTVDPQVIESGSFTPPLLSLFGINGRPAINFGQNSNIRGITLGNPSTLEFDPTVPDPWFWVALWRDVATGTTLAWANDTDKVYQMGRSAAGFFGYYGDSAVDSEQTLSTTGTHVLSFGRSVSNPAKYAVRVNGVEGDLIDPGTVSTSAADITIGMRRDASGAEAQDFVAGSTGSSGALMHRCVIMPGDTADDDLLATEGLYAHLGGVPLVAGHPYRNSPKMVSTGGAARNSIAIGIGL